MTPNFTIQMTTELNQLLDFGSSRCTRGLYKGNLSESTKWVMGHTNSDLGKWGFALNPVPNSHDSYLNNSNDNRVEPTPGLWLI
jgi:hypothetical protein